MKMYSIYSESEQTNSLRLASQRLADFVVSTLKLMSVTRLAVVYCEYTTFPDSIKTIEFSKSPLLIKDMLISLAEGKSFFTLGDHDTVLIVPFEGLQFNLITIKEIVFPIDPTLNVEDSSEILSTYRDAYEPFGLNKIFARNSGDMA